jgi:hypothetical protein
LGKPRVRRGRRAVRRRPARGAGLAPRPHGLRPLPRVLHQIPSLSGPESFVPIMCPERRQERPETPSRYHSLDTCFR